MTDYQIDYQKEALEILDWFCENLPNEYLGYFDKSDQHIDTTISQMVIFTIEELQERIKELEAAR